ncbi:EamA domain-containing membrane protein RarD [Maridesulfovibrio ferrireducens]|uniref:EamA domain-containing membrane protein RarD n=1 Tax=Maridesulfovibrio ferrireducens TaxID=246191 RepID=A0A1G9G1R9_9BACT|nr:DMT family transporter [Maridesulfovibrio ferrireducens]SDK94600.1 EamA domain-containing membrane protein RarD [Maridesulfovibrio ferrireducens]
MTSNSKHLPIIAFVLLGVIWGSNFICMKLASELISPAQIVLFRTIFGFFPVLIYALVKKSLCLDHLKHSAHFLVMALLATSLNYYCFVKGTSLLLTGVAGALSGSIPLFTFILAILFIPEEKPSLMKIVGIAIGFIGVVIIARPSGDSLLSSNFEGVFYMVAGSLSVGSSFVYARKFITPLNIPASAITTYQLGFAMILLSLTTSYDGMSAIWTSYNASIGLIVGLGLLGTGLAYIIYYYIASKMGAVTASSVSYIPPLVALVIGSAIVGEPIELVDYFATALIFAGVYMLRRK